MQKLTVQPKCYIFSVFKGKNKNRENLEEFKNDKPIAFWEYIHQSQPGFQIFQFLFYKEIPF